MSNIYQQLSEPFPQEMERRLNKGGANLVYIPVSEVINRLNKVVGTENWSFTVKDWRQVGNSIVAHVSVVTTINGNVVTREGVGGQRIKMSKQGDPIDIGDEVKGAVSDALKKAVQTLGIGLYLARSEDAIEIESVIEAGVQTQSQQPQEVGSPRYFQVKELFEALNDEKKQNVKKFWSEYSGGVSKPLSKMDDEELDVIMSEIVRLNFDGAIAVDSTAKPSTKKAEMPARKDLD